MPLIKHRPRLRLLLPRSVTRGETFVATAVLEARHAVAIEWLDVRLDGWLRATVGSGQATSRYAKEIVRSRARLSGPREIPVGTTRFDCRFTLPPRAPPSFKGWSTSSSYAVTVHAGIAWWPDAKQSFYLDVVMLEAARRPARPVLLSSAANGPTGGDPYVELGLADTTIDSGGVVDGSVALGNVRDARFVGCDIALVAIERARDHERELSRYSIHLPARAEGDAIPFSMRLPVIPPSFDAGLVRVRWLVEARARRRMARDVVVCANVVVVPGSPGAQRVRRAPPDVGAERVARVWQSVGERLGYELLGGELVKTRGDARVAIRRDFARGPRVLAEIRTAPLGIGLEGGALRGVHRWVGERGFPLGDAKWDARHRVSGRFEQQVKAFGAILVTALAEQRVAELSDERIVLEIDGAGLDPRRLGALARAADRIAQLLPAARAAIPPPPGFDVGAWRALATELAGRFEPSCIAVHGELDDHGVDIVTEWAGNVAHATRVVLRPRARIADRWVGVIPTDAALLSALPADAQTAASALCAVAGDVAIDVEALTLTLPAPLERPDRVLDRIGDLAHLVEKLSTARRGYR